MKDLPRYYIVGDRPVKAVATSAGGMEVLAFDWKTGEFSPELTYLSRLVLPDPEVDRVSQDAFDAHVRRLREELSGSAG